MAARKKSVEVQNGITLNAIIFKDMVARAKKGASGNLMVPPSQMMAIELVDNKLTLITTDGTNYLFVSQDKVEGDDFYVTVMAETFAQLIAKTTSDKITLALEGNALKVMGNGEYTLDLPEEEGELIKFPDPRNEVELEPLPDIKLTTVSSIIETAKPSLAVTLEEPCYTNYYIGDNVIATDIYKMCGMKLKLWDEPRLISAELLDLVNLMTDEDIKVSAKDDIIMFSTPDCVVYGRTMEGLDDFAADDIMNALDREFNSSCKVGKAQLLQVLDRLSLFVTKNDKHIINLMFTKEGLELSSKKSTGVELVKYVDSENFKDFICKIDIEMFKSQIKVISGEDVEIHYGQNTATNKAIKFVEGNTVLMLALIDEEEDEE